MCQKCAKMKLMQDEELKYWLSLAKDLKIGAVTFKKLYSHFKSLKEAWQKPPAFLAESVSELKKNVDPDQELEKLKKADIGVVTIRDKNYPVLLKEIYDPPALLFYKGEIKKEDSLAVAVVGSRRFSSYGQRMAAKIGRQLAENGVTVVSGLALGIDAIAQEAALKAGGRTIAALGCGLDRIYPVANINLANQIIKSGSGAIVSEFGLGVPPLAHHFPIRNRVISGLSLGTVVIEAAEKSGSLITAQSALDQNREVFALPGDIERSSAYGPNELIKNGAKIVTNIDDILSELKIEKKASEVKMRQLVDNFSSDNVLEQKIIDTIGNDNLHIDKIAKIIKLNIATLNSTLLLMEMKGMVRNSGGGVYQKI